MHDCNPDTAIPLDDFFGRGYYNKIRSKVGIIQRQKVNLCRRAASVRLPKKGRRETERSSTLLRKPHKFLRSQPWKETQEGRHVESSQHSLTLCNFLHLCDSEAHGAYICTHGILRL